jgi:hypothetical protein
MTLRRAPTLATWFLKLFCSDAEHEAVIGDLTEQYQHGRGRFWYWRQVLDIAFLGLYCKVAQRPLTTTHKVPVGSIFALVLIVATLAAVALSDMGPIFLAAVFGGILVGIVRFEQTSHRTTSEQAPQSPAPRIVRIDSSKIPIGGGLGAGILILVLFIAVLHDLPELRRWAMPGLLAGLVVAIGLRVWRRVHPRDMDKHWLSIKSK